jgi:hypothetical protein
MSFVAMHKQRFGMADHWPARLEAAHAGQAGRLVRPSAKDVVLIGGLLYPVTLETTA